MQIRNSTVRKRCNPDSTEGIGLGVKEEGERSFHDIPAIMIPMMYRFQKEKVFFFPAGINLWLSLPVLPTLSLSAGYKF